MNLYEIFSTRELAVMIWVSIGITWTLCFRSIRKTYVSLIKSVFATKIIRVFIAMVIYVTGLIVALWSLDLWYPALLKDTIFWFIFAGFVPIFKIPNAGNDNRYFRKSLKGIFTLTLFTEFVVNYFTFSLWKELILVPLLWIMAMLLAVSEKQKEHEIVNRFLKKVLKWLSIALALYVGVQLIIHWKTFFTWTTLGSLSISPLLSLLYIPFLFGLTVIMSYQNAFSRLKMAVPSQVYVYGRRLAILKWKMNKTALDRWTSRLLRNRPVNKNDLINSVMDLKAQLDIERDPPGVDAADGWSPYTAKHFMAVSGMPTRDYENYVMEEWSCTSNYFYPDKKNSSDHISYSIEGNRFVATKLSLHLSNQTKETAVASHQVFEKYCAELFKVALKTDMPVELHVAVLLAKPLVYVISGTTISVKIHAYNNLEQWHDVTFEIAKTSINNNILHLIC